jgi:hypothetical protein
MTSYHGSIPILSPLMKLILFATPAREKPGLSLGEVRCIDVLELGVAGLGESRFLALAVSRMA